MTSATFRVTTRGVRPGYSAELAADQVAALFKCSKEQIAPLLGSKPVVVKRGLTQEAAGKYARALESCGCLCAIEAESAPAAGEAAPPQAAPLSHRQLSAVIPVLRRAAPRSPDADPVVVRPFVGDLEIVFRTEADGDFVRQAALGASMMSVDRLYELAIYNLYTLTHPRLTFKQFVLEDSEGGTAGSRFFSYVETGDGLEAPCLLLQPVWEAVAAEFKGALRIAVPTAGTCLFCSADDFIAVSMMCDIAGETWFEAGDGALSALTYSMDGAGRVAMVPDGQLLRKALPPPALAPTPDAQLLRPAEQAVATDAALLTLSDERLRKVQPQLLDTAHWTREDDRARWLSDIRHALARGDARAAVVVDAATAVVASYTDELDCVVLLKFDPALAQAHGWRDGTRLLSANSYFRRDGGIAPDLRPGPGDEGRWGNVWPLIADLLTDDDAVLAARKKAIAEPEWERVLQLSRRALADRVIPRDGRPVTSHHPAHPPAAPPAPAPASASGAPARTGAARRKSTRQAGTFSACVKHAGIGGLCAWAAWGAGRHVAEMPHDGLFYVACFGIAVFGAIGLSCLWSAANYLRGA
jgi:hypothetical protein